MQSNYPLRPTTSAEYKTGGFGQSASKAKFCEEALEMNEYPEWYINIKTTLYFKLTTIDEHFFPHLYIYQTSMKSWKLTAIDDENDLS